jgi:hypothetical protein
MERERPDLELLSFPNSSWSWLLFIIPFAGGLNSQTLACGVMLDMQLAVGGRAMHRAHRSTAKSEIDVVKKAEMCGF